MVERIVVAQNGKKIDLRVESTLRSIQKMVAGEGVGQACKSLLRHAGSDRAKL